MSAADETPDPQDVQQDLQESTPGSSGPDRAEGGMGVSSERVGHAGPGQHTTDGLRDNSEDARPAGGDVLPEQHADGEQEDNPTGIEPKAGYPSLDPRSDS